MLSLYLIIIFICYCNRNHSHSRSPKTCRIQHWRPKTNWLELVQKLTNLKRSTPLSNKLTTSQMPKYQIPTRWN